MVGTLIQLEKHDRVSPLRSNVPGPESVAGERRSCSKTVSRSSCGRDRKVGIVIEV
jgi:hypothetical protein